MRKTSMLLLGMGALVLAAPAAKASPPGSAERASLESLAPVPTTLTYVGPTSGHTGTPVALSAQLLPAAVGAPIVFTLNSAETCTGTVAIGGFASCTIIPAEAPGTYSLTASFAGNPAYGPSSTTVPFTIAAPSRIPTTLTYTGPTSGVRGAPVTLSAALSPAVVGAPIVFTLNAAETCTGSVNAGGFASCAITPAEVPGPYTLAVSYAGNAAYAPSSTSATFTVTAPPVTPTTLTYTGPTSGIRGAPITLSALLSPAVVGAPIVFTLNAAETCTGTVNLGGFASCAITPAETPGPYPLTASFAGTAAYGPSSASATFTVIAAPLIPTTLTYVGPTSGQTLTPVTLSALLTPVVVGAPIVFTLNAAETCTGTVNLGGFASCSITPTEAPGPYSLAASFAGTATYAASSTTATFTIAAPPVTPTTLANTGPTTGVTGAPVTLSARLTPALIGAPITFTLDATETCIGLVAAGGFASCAITPAEAPGTYSLVASFAGNAAFSASSATVPFIVTAVAQTPTTLTYTGPTSGQTGTPVTLSALLSPVIVGAPITFALNSSETCTGSVNLGGFASCTIIPAEAPGPYPLTADFAGSATFAASTAAATFTVTAAPQLPTTLAYTGPPSGVTGAPVTLTALLVPAVIGAPITFTLDGTETCTGAISLGGFASCSITPTEAAGTYTLALDFAGSPGYAPASTTAPFLVTDAPLLPTALTYTGPTSGATGASVTLSALLAPALTGAPITFTLNGAETCTSAVGVGGIASCAITPTEAPGPYSLVASFAGTATFAASSATVTFTVTAAPLLPTALLYTGPTTVITGAPLTAAALLTPALIGAPIVFTLNATETCTGTVNLGGFATCTMTPAEPAGTYPMIASFAGNATYASSTATAMILIVDAEQIPTTLTYTGPTTGVTVDAEQIPTTLTYTGPTTGVTGAPVTVSALLTPALIGAPIVFTLDATETCTGSVSLGGFASCELTPAEPAGTYSLVASFAGNAAYTSSSATAAFTVTEPSQIPTTLTYTGPASGDTGALVTLSATLAPGLVGAPIVFTLDGTDTCTGTVALGGIASCAITPTEAPGTYSLIVTFAGTASYAPSSTTVSFDVTTPPPIPTTLAYTGPTTGVAGTPVTLTALLAPALSGAPIVFTLNAAETCTGTVDLLGIATCDITPAEAPGTYSMVASFAGTPAHAASSDTASFDVTAAPLIPTALLNTGATTGVTGTPVTVAALLTPALAGGSIVFTLDGAETCTGSVDVLGAASCSLTPAEAPGTYSLVASFAGTPVYAASTTTVPFIVTSAPLTPTTLLYTGPTTGAFGLPVTLTALLTPGLVGAPIVFTLNAAETCTGAVNVLGIASCAITPLEAPGTYALVASFAGTPIFASSSDTASFDVTAMFAPNSELAEDDAEGADPGDELDELGGCQSTSAPHAAWLLALLVVASRARRRRAR